MYLHFCVGERVSLLQEYGHRVRLATHSNFEDFVLSAGLEFYPLGGDPKVLAGRKWCILITSLCQFKEKSYLYFSLIGLSCFELSTRICFDAHTHTKGTYALQSIMQPRNFLSPWFGPVVSSVGPYQINVWFSFWKDCFTGKFRKENL